ncbi:MAG: hypothetical protein IPI81_10430 [Flavobacteriales bacterium]|nr:hypothetical protein [Flavobacteriales bacterium]
MKLHFALIPLGGLFVVSTVQAQPDTLLLAQDEHYLIGDAGDDPLPELNIYDAYNSTIGGDSLRQCGAFPCTGWVEDKYPNGQLRHRGYYDSGRLTVFKNYYRSGQLEREFKAVDATHCSQRTWHPNGQLRSCTRYRDGVVIQYEDYYVSGQLRYVEERHKEHHCFTRLELYAGDGTPISLLRMVDKGKLEVEQKEFHPGGTLKSQGRARYNRATMDSQRVGTWVYFDTDGTKIREEDLVGGKVLSVR